MKELFSFDDKKFTDKDLLLYLKRLGIKDGDCICIHSRIFEFGKPLLKPDELLYSICNVFLDAVGEKGTVLMPTFTYSFCKNEIYDKINSKSRVGVLGEFFRKMDGVKRTNDPIFSFAVYGKRADEFLVETDNCFGENSPYDVLAKNDGKMLMFGLKEDGYTFYIYTEQQANVSYRYFKEFSGTIIDEYGKSKEKTIKYYVRNLDINPILDSNKRLKILEDHNILKVENFAGSIICSIDAKKDLDLALSTLKLDELYFNLK
ncbi:AAC(3) family N-acetyltransferase [Campylobacter pinnipediorum]|uniref:AAC(3) family N-acetyltransferase n=1 Tax=Campylobacter pinnipediorum TaxID=1965231 RepID=UPI000994F9A2|nr:AAC(3) family N-acetyltransferase [Campylobacter pinnipediorum]AQW83670.1 aminoglycoside N3'-acetyltransferase [Campylobacter pinnipediorum subsp. pinnipediorum]